MDLILDKISALWPEEAMLLGAVVCLATGLSPSASVRRATPGVAAVALVLAGALVAWRSPVDPTGLGLGGVTIYVKLAVVAIGLLLLMVAVGMPEQRERADGAERDDGFQPEFAARGEFFAFFLVSLTGLMLTAGAGDLVWLFLALELTSLPTYVMVATGRDRLEAQEAGVKYFFLGALSVAFFLYGFAMLYGATGFTNFAEMRQALLHGDVSPGLLLLGLILSVLGLSFKMAAAPMHFYAADVYQGAAAPVTAFLAFVPKAAGVVAIILLLSLIGWPLDQTFDLARGGEALVWVLWIMAAVTMTVGNVLALLQQNVKRVLAYSSVAHSGYLLVGVIAGPGAGGGILSDGLAAVLFYLLAYGLATIAAFAVLGCLRVGGARGDEVQTYDDLSGLVHRHPVLAIILAVASLSLLGVPPLIGFLGKVYLFAPALGAGYVWLVVIAVVNSAISAGYYLPIASACFFGKPRAAVVEADAPLRRIAAAVAALGAVVFGFAGSVLVEPAHRATRPAISTVESPATGDRVLTVVVGGARGADE